MALAGVPHRVRHRGHGHAAADGARGGALAAHGDPLDRELAQRWAKGTAILFAVGAVSGTVLSFELGLLWPGVHGVRRPDRRLPFSMEGFAFFFEAIFLGVYLYGWDRVPARRALARGRGRAPRRARPPPRSSSAPTPG
jgi:hypothetical protein